MDTTQEQYSKIIESGNSAQLLAFLKSLDDKQRKNLVPLIKKDVKRLGEYQWHEVSIGGLRGGTYQQDGTKNQLEMIFAGKLFLFSKIKPYSNDAKS